MGNSTKSKFEHIYKTHYAMVLQVCLGYSKWDDTLAKDLAQDVFVSVFENLERFRGDANIRTWIYRITVNTCLQSIRKRKQHANHSLSNNDIQSPEELSTYNEPDIPKLYKGISKLNAIDRLIILMVLEDEPYNQIANIIGIKPTNLRVKIHRIKKQLKTILNTLNDGE